MNEQTHLQEARFNGEAGDLPEAILSGWVNRYIEMLKTQTSSTGVEPQQK